MSNQIQFVSAATFSLDALADLFTRSFEAYFYPGVTTSQVLSQRLRIEQLDLLRSPLLVVDEQPAGLALLGLRDTRAWCGGFGITMPFRGRGLARVLAQAMVQQAREAGARTLGLEVLTRNERALKTYLRAGFVQQRDLHIFEWKRPESFAPAPPAPLLDTSVPVLLEHYAAMHPVPAAWQRELPSLLVRGGLHGLALQHHTTLVAYVLVSMRDDNARIEDIGARQPEDAARLLRALQARYASLVSVNEPENSHVTAAFFETGFAESDRQHELLLEL